MYVCTACASCINVLLGGSWVSERPTSRGVRRQMQCQEKTPKQETKPSQMIHLDPIACATWSAVTSILTPTNVATFV